MTYRCKFCRQFSSPDRSAVEIHADRCREEREQRKASAKLERAAKNIHAVGQRIGHAVQQVANVAAKGERLIADIQHAAEHPEALLDALRNARQP